MRRLSVLLALSFCWPLLAASPAAAQSCTPGEATATLDINNVRAGLHNQGGLFYPSSLYEVPKGSGVNALYAGGLWVGGMVDGELRMAASTYAHTGKEYEWFPGPLQPDGTPPNPDDCSAYDRIWTITQAALDHYEQTGEATADLAEWPAELGAPVVDGDGVAGNYDLAAGDRPELIGDQMAWWIMNDAAGPHLTTLAEPMGMVLRVTAYAYDAAPDSPLINTTFYRYRMTYRPTVDAPLVDAYFGHYADPDLGQYTDDYVGSDPSRDLAYVYNGDNLDEGDAGYGAQPPALGFVVLDGATEAPRDLSHFLYYNSDGTAQGTPNDAEDRYFYLQGRWKNGSPMTYGGDGFGDDLGLGETDYMYSSTPPFFWSEENIDGVGTRNNPSDRRFVFSTGPFTMQPGETREVTVGIVWSQRANRLLSVRQLQRDVDEVQAFFDGVPYVPSTDPAPRAPTLVSPPDDAFIEIEAPVYRWQPPADQVEGEVFYRLEIAADPDFDQIVDAYTVLGDSVTSVKRGLPASNSLFYWRVWAETIGGAAASSARVLRTGRYSFARPAVAGEGDGIVEVADAGGPLPPGDWDEAGAPYAGNTVWHDPNASGDYLVSAGGGSGTLDRLVRYFQFAAPRDFEMRFTESGGYCVYAFEDDRIATVPFEIWDIGEGTPDDASDDRRMIPFCLANGETFAGQPGTPSDWSDTYGTRSPAGDTEPFFGLPASDWVYWMDPDTTAGGYDAFAATADASGGAGAIYDSDLDTSPDGYYADLHGGFVYPIGRFVLADVAGDGTPPPSGTVIRINTTKPDTLNYEATLSGLFVPGATTAAQGAAQADVVINFGSSSSPVLLQGSFDGLSAPFTSLSVGSASPSAPDADILRLDDARVTLSDDGRSGQFAVRLDLSDATCFASGGFCRAFVQIHSQTYPEGELRGYFVPAGNLPPEAPRLTTPAAGAVIAVEGADDTRLPVRWAPVAEPDGTEVYYRWELLAADGQQVLLSLPFSTDTQAAVSYAALDAVLKARGVAPGALGGFYQRVVATDGSLATPGPARTLLLRRGTLVPTGTEGALPAAFALQASYPNPFREQTTLVFDLPAAARVSVDVYDLLGRRVLSVPGRLVAAGAGRTLVLEAAGLASGVYLYRLEAETPARTWQATGRLVRVR